MYSNYMFLCVIIHVLILQRSCTSEPVRSPTLVLSSPGDFEDTYVVMKREHDNLTLTCELRGDPNPREYVWTYAADNGDLREKRTFKIEPAVGRDGSALRKTDLQISESGLYICSTPPFSVTKYILVQNTEPQPDTPNKAETEDLYYARLNSIDRHTPNKRRTLRSIDGNHNVYKGTGNTVISGENNVLKGNGNTVISGENNTLKGNGNTVKSGENNFFKGNDSEVTGNTNVIKGNNCRVFGNNNVVKGNNNTLHGDRVVVIGNNNTIHASGGVFTGDNINN